MKKHLLLLLTALCCIFPTFAAIGDTYTFTIEEALALVKPDYANRDVDYYLYFDETEISVMVDVDSIKPNGINPLAFVYPQPEVSPKSYWKIFVDANPTALWAHEAKMYYIAKTYYSSNPIVKTTDMFVPPIKGELQPLSVKLREINASVSTDPNSMPAAFGFSNKYAEKTHVIIINGGGNAHINLPNYWNDCSLVYTMLKNVYKIPEENFGLFISDGDATKKDMRLSDNTYGYSSHDLDFDNKDERILEASKSYILRHIDSLSETLDEDAHVLIFLVGPGRQINDSSSSMYLWDNDELTDETFADWVKLLSDKDMCVNVFCGQNYNSGFFDKLSDVGCVVTAPRSLPQSINSAAFLLYDRFVYNWVSAICSKTADTDNNGFVSMYEAYQYMQNLTTNASQDIQYSSSPIYLGYDLAMNNIPPAVDLFMRDDKYDVGVEPYITQRYSSTPDLWMKNGFPDNNSPTYYDHEWIDKDCLISFVIANIINRGRKAYDGISDCKSASFYWSDSRCQNTKEDYLGHIEVNHILTGEPIGSISITKRIEPGESVIYEYPWPFKFTNVIRYLDESGFYPFRILGLISDNSTNTALSEEDNTNKYENKRMVDRLTYIVSTNKSYLQLYLLNDAQEIENSDVVLYCETTNSEYPDLTLNLENKLVSQWEGQGYLENMVQEATDKRIFKTKRLPISEEQRFKIGNIELEPEEISPISLTFDFDETSATGEKYIYSLTQTDSNGKIMSGAEIVVTAPTPAQLQSQIVVTENEDGTYLLSADDTKDVSSIRWQNAEGEVIGREQTLNVNPRENGNITMILINSDGELSQDSVVLDLLTGIKSTETSADMLNVEFKAPIGVNGATLQLSPATSSTSQQVAVSVAAGAESADIDISNLQSGIYVLSMTEEGSVVDTRKLQIR